jgi:hypothetical protein
VLPFAGDLRSHLVHSLVATHFYTNYSLFKGRGTHGKTGFVAL